MMNRKLLFFISILFIGLSKSYSQPRQGDVAVEIALPSVTGDTLKLSSFKGKVILLDFWASWCMPCRFANKGMGKLYSKYKDKGFEIFSVSLDNESGDWMKAIKDDKITWKQVISYGGWSAPTALQWGIVALPTSYLIDQEGRLIAMDLEGRRLEKALKTMLDK
jgi:thiol-disulfide isomerase/thioredoxin